MERIGIRELRQDLSNRVKGASRGEPLIVTIDGEPTAKLVPLGRSEGKATLEDLIAAGRVIAGRTRQPESPPFTRVKVGRPSKEILDEIRADRI